MWAKEEIRMQKKENFFTDNPDIRFHLEKRIDWDALWAWMTPEQKEASACTEAKEVLGVTFDAMEIFGDICGSILAPNAVEVEKQEITLIDGEVTLPEALQTNNQSQS